MIEGSGSGRPKNTWIRIRIRIRIRNTGCLKGGRDVIAQKSVLLSVLCVRKYFFRIRIRFRGSVIIRIQEAN